MPVFPLPKIPNWGYHKGSGKRWFGAPRDKSRIHAACDLIARPGTPIYAVDHGTVWYSSGFYLQTDELTIRHPNFLVRYGEIAQGKLAPGIKRGEPVKPGQLIGWVGRLKMLHFEMYKDPHSSDPLTQRSNKTKYDYVTPGNYQRRSDLIDPTTYLDQWKFWTSVTNWVEDVIEDIW